MKSQIICLGASSLYGVGHTKGGWPELLKADIHKKQYGPNGKGQVNEVYSIGVPGATLSDMKERTEICLKTIRKPKRQVICVLQLGANDAKALDNPDNFFTTTEDYKKKITEFLGTVNELSDKAVCLGLFPMDQDKVMPVSKNPKTYFSNERIRKFEKILCDTAESLGMNALPVFQEAVQSNWINEYQYRDGIHPNDKGYQWLYQKVKPEIEKLLS